VGNIIPCYGTGNNGELAAVEYAVVELGIEDLIVCGHTGCGAMKALVSAQSFDATSRTPSIASWLHHADATREIIRAHYNQLTGDALLKAAAEENVLVQLEHLRTLPVIRAGVSSGKVRLHGWMYKIESGELFNYDAVMGQYVKFRTSPPASGGNGITTTEKEGLSEAPRRGGNLHHASTAFTL
jgi:carbonic anhydrase